MQNNQIVQINIDPDDLARLYHLLNHDVLKTPSGFHRLSFQDDAAYFRGFFSYFIDKSKQPDGVGRSSVPPSGVVGQESTLYDSKCTCDQCTCMGFGFGSGANEGSEHYPFVVGE